MTGSSQNANSGTVIRQCRDGIQGLDCPRRSLGRSGVGVVDVSHSKRTSRCNPDTRAAVDEIGMC